MLIYTSFDFISVIPSLCEDCFAVINVLLLFYVSFRTASLQPPRRHQPSQNFNRYRTIDRPPPKEDKSSTTAPHARPRYSVKTRTKMAVHDPPKSMKRYEWKEWTTRPKSNLENVIGACFGNTRYGYIRQGGGGVSQEESKRERAKSQRKPTTNPRSL